MVLAGAVSPTQSNLEGAVGDVVTEVSQTWGLTSSGLFTLGLLSRGPQSLSSAAPGADEVCKPGLRSRPAGFSHVQPCVCGERLTHRSTLEHKVGGAGPGRVRALRSPSARRALLTPEPPGPWAPVIPAHGGCAPAWAPWLVGGRCLETRVLDLQSTCHPAALGHESRWLTLSSPIV